MSYDSAFRRVNAEKLYNDREDQLRGLSGDVLRDLARNESAEWRWRKAAVKLMLDKKFPQVNHPDLKDLVRDVQQDIDAHNEVESVVETAIEGQIPSHESKDESLGQTPDPSLGS